MKEYYPIKKGVILVSYGRNNKVIKIHKTWNWNSCINEFYVIETINMNNDQHEQFRESWIRQYFSPAPSQLII